MLLAIAVGYVQPLRSYRDAPPTSPAKQAEVDALAQATSPEQRIQDAGKREFIEREARKLGLVRAGRASLHRQGSRALEARAAGACQGQVTMIWWTTARSSPGSSAGLPAPFRRVAVRCPYGFPAVTEQAPLRAGRGALPDHLLSDLPLARGRHRSRSRPREESSAGRAAAQDDAELGASLARADARAAEAQARASRRDRRHPRAGRTSSACTPTPPSRSPGPATSSASGSWAR